MSFDHLRNCPRCGELFVKQVKDICPACVEKELNELQTCIHFLRNKENQKSTIVEMSEKTGVSVRQITQFILEKRLTIETHPNLSYPCSSCGEWIRDGKFCRSCSEEWEKSLQQVSDNSPSNNPKREAGFYVRKHKES